MRGFNLAQHWEHTCERDHIARQDGRDFGVRQVLQVPCERVDQAVEGFIEDRLSLIAAAGQNDGVGPFDSLLQKAIQQRRLAGARRSVEIENSGAAADHFGHGLVEHLLMAPTSDQRQSLDRDSPLDD